MLGRYSLFFYVDIGANYSFIQQVLTDRLLYVTQYPGPGVHQQTRHANANGKGDNSFPCKEVGECGGWCVQHCSEPPHAHSSACLSGFLLKIVFQKYHPAILGQRICTFTYPPEIPGQIVVYTTVQDSGL